MTKKMVKIAYGSVPKAGGTFTFYRNHRAHLLKHGIDMTCVSVGKEESELWDRNFEDESTILLAPGEVQLKRLAQLFVEWCIDNDINIVMAINSAAIICSLPHLPESIRVVSRCANGFPIGYRLAMAGYDRVAAIIALTPRLRDDLIEDYDVAPDKLHLIPNGVDNSRFRLRTHHNRDQPIRIGFLGRLEHQQKGVFHIPKIIDRLRQRQIDFQVKIAGKGIHESKLRKLLGESLVARQCEFVGELGPEEVPGFLAQIDVFLFTSHFEGCPNSLLEAMSAGCVPVSWTIPGITDFLIEQQVTGYLSKSGDYAQITSHIACLANDRNALTRMSNAMRKHTLENLSIELCAKRYAAIFHRVMDEPAPPTDPVMWRYFITPTEFQKRFKWIPKVIRLMLGSVKRQLQILIMLRE